jgi:hypothetical protein
MNLKTNAILAVAFAGLLAFVYFYEIKEGEEREAVEQREKKLLDFDGAEPKRFVIDRGDTTIELEKRDDGWFLTSPVESAADESALRQFVDNVRGAERERSIADSAAVAEDASLTQRYELATPLLELLVETDSTALDTIYFGPKNPTGAYVYAQQGGRNREIFTIRSWRYDSLDKGVFALRDRRVLPFDKKEVREIRVARPEGKMVLLKEEEDWRVKEPTDVPANLDAVDSLLSKIYNAKIDTFVAEVPSEDEIAGYGLAGLVNFEVSLILGEERAEKRLRLGATEDGIRYFARDLSRPPVFLVDSTIVTALLKPPHELRDRKPFKFDRSDVTRIEAGGRDERIVAEKDTSGTWQIVSPQSDRAPRSWKFNSLMTDLTEMEVVDFVSDNETNVAKYGLDDPSYSITLVAVDEPLLEVILGTSKSDLVYCMRRDVPSVYAIREDVAADLSLSLDQLLQKKPEAQEQ